MGGRYLRNGTAKTEQQILSVTEARSALNVRRADNQNRLSLERIDAEAAAKIAALGRSDRSQQRIAAELVVAGVQMYQLIQSDRDAWFEFKKPFEIKVNGTGEDREFREVAAVLWRSLNKEPSERRQKRSLYGLAIATAQKWYETGCTDPEKLAAKIANTRGGLKSVAKLRRDKLAHDSRTSVGDRPVRWIKIKRPMVTTLYACTPEGEQYEVDAALAAPVLASIRLFQ